MGNYMDDRCVICGKYVPEGRQVCYECEWNHSKERPHEMTAREFVKAKNRMCGIYYVNYCKGCPLSEGNNNQFKPCVILEKENPEAAISIVEQWAKEHPEKRSVPVFPHIYLGQRVLTVVGS